jgi:integrase
MPKINIGKKHQATGIYTNVFTEGKNGKKKTYRAVFALWDGKDWNIETKREGLVTKADGFTWIEGKQAEHKQKGTAVMLSKGSFAEFVERYYKPYLKTKGLATYDEECQKLNTMTEFFGNEPVKNIDYLRIMEFRAWLLAKPYTREKRVGKTVETVEYERSDASAHRYLSRLRHLLKFAIKAKQLHALPAFDDAIIADNESPKTANITHDEFTRMLAACETIPKGGRENRHRWRLVLIAAYTLGCRVGELWEIRRGDITSLDEQNRTGVITIKKNKIARGKSKITTKKVAITQWLYDEMQTEGAFAKTDDERLFMWTKEYRRVIKSLKKLAGVNEEATFHTLRAASATNRDAAGQDFDSLQAELGHAKGSSVTRKHYIRPQDKQIMDSAAKYNDYLEKMRAETVIQTEGLN